MTISMGSSILGIIAAKRLNLNNREWNSRKSEGKNTAMEWLNFIGKRYVRVRNLSIRYIFLILALNNMAFGIAPQKMARQQYIVLFSKLAIQEMNEFHIPASITMAQACLESGDGNSPLAREANNHFGIKCNSSWSGPFINQDDDAHDECFRKYNTPIESFRDHSKFLTGSNRYQFLFDYKISDYKKWAYGLKKAGYATDPQYPERLIKIIEEFQLHQLDGYYNSNTVPDKFDIATTSKVRQKSKSGTDDFSIDPYRNRDIEIRNGLKAILAVEGDTYRQIAAEFSLKEWEICTYNDVEKDAELTAGSIVYLQEKRGSAQRGNNFHVMKQGETLWYVAQRYGVRLKAVYRKNRITPGKEPAMGKHISLRKKIRRT